MGIILNSIRKYFPAFWVKAINVPRAKRRWKNSLEEKIIERKEKLTQEEGGTSLLFFSTHKSGSSIALKFLKELGRENHLHHVNYDGYISSVSPKAKVLFDDKEFLKNAFRSKGYFFGCFRSFRKLPNLDKYNVVLLLRDPRDVLVSYYYSMKYNNRIHQMKGVEVRKRLRYTGIDDYVLELVPRFKQVYTDYLVSLSGKPNVLFTKYEELIQDSATWLSEVAVRYQLRCSTELLNRISSEVHNKPKKEEKHKHHRKSSPGEYLEKLDPATIAVLNKEFEVILKQLNYQIN